MMQTYEHYKESGIDWIGPIPEHWEVRRLKYIFQIQKRIAGELGYDVLSITQTGIKVKNINSGEGQLAMDYSKYQLAYEGDFAMNHMDLLTGWVDISKYNGVISPDYRVFNLINKTNYPKYFLYILQDCYSSKIFYANGQGVSMLGRWRFPTENFNNFSFPIPPILEQKAIANFLDDKTAKIDALVQTKEQQIEKLKELRQAKIHQAVTKGLDANAPTKNSGVEWIGEIPAHWEVKRLKNLFQIVNGATPSSAILNYWEGDITWVTPKDINNIKYISQSERNISISGYKSCGTSLVPKGSIILTTRAPIGKVVIASKELCTNQGCKSLVKRSKQNIEFIYNVLEISSYVLNSLGTGTTFMELSNVALKNFQIATPPIQEQEQIVSYLDEVTGKIDQAITQKQEQIAKLKEYKQSLINDVVTGKVKVC